MDPSEGPLPNSDRTQPLPQVVRDSLSRDSPQVGRIQRPSPLGNPLPTNGDATQTQPDADYSNMGENPAARSVNNQKSDPQPVNTGSTRTSSTVKSLIRKRSSAAAGSGVYMPPGSYDVYSNLPIFEETIHP